MRDNCLNYPDKWEDHFSLSTSVVMQMVAATIDFENGNLTGPAFCHRGKCDLIDLSYKMQLEYQKTV